MRISILIESEYAITAHKSSAEKKGASDEKIVAVAGFRTRTV